MVSHYSSFDDIDHANFVVTIGIMIPYLGWINYRLVKLSSEVLSLVVMIELHIYPLGGIFIKAAEFTMKKN